VGKACTSAYEDGAYKACTAICDGRNPPKKDGIMGAFCRPYLTQTPKPTIHKACRTGYALGYEKAYSKARSTDFAEPVRDEEEEEKKEAEAPRVTIETKREPEPEPAPVVEEEKAPAPPAEPKLLVNMPVTVDEEEVFLQIREGDDAAAKVAAFCDQHMSDSAESCVRQLTPHVEKKLRA